MSQSVWTVLALPAALSEPGYVMMRALIQQLLCDTPAPAVANVSTPGVVRKLWMCVLAGVECMAHYVFAAHGELTGPVS